MSASQASTVERDGPGRSPRSQQCSPESRASGGPGICFSSKIPPPVSSVGTYRYDEYTYTNYGYNGICLTITGINVMVSRRLVFYQGGPK